MTNAPLVLVIDDDLDLLDLLEEVLTGAGYRVRRASNGAAALAVHDTEVAAAIVDLRLPDLDGWEVLEQLASRPRRMPVVVFSGLPLWPAAGERLSRLGVVEVLEKPLDRLQTLVDALERALVSQPPPETGLGEWVVG